MTRDTRSTGLPSVRTPDDVVHAWNNLRAVVEQWKGTSNPLDGVVTKRDLYSANIADILSINPRTGAITNPKTQTPTSGGGQIEPGIQFPSAASGLSVTSGFNMLFLSWNDPTKIYHGHAYTEVWRAGTDDLGQAVLIDRAAGHLYTDFINQTTSVTRYYWIRWVNENGQAGPFNSTSGTSGSTATDPSYLLERLSGQITESELYGDLNSRIDLIDADNVGLVDRVTEVESQIDSLEVQAEFALFVQDDEPVPGENGVPDPIPDGARWYDQDDNNHPYYWNGSQWLDLEDPRIGDNESAITALEATVNDPSTGVAANASAIDVLDTTVTNQGNTITAHSSAITDLESTVDDPDNGVVANASAVDSLDTRVTSAEGSISVNATDITSLESTVNDPDNGVVANADAVTALDTRVTTAEGTISTHSSEITALESTVNDPDDGVNANASAISSLDTRVTTAEGTISTHSSEITALESTVNDPDDGVVANAGAVFSLDTRVTTAEGDITSQASDITALESTVNDPSTGVDANASAISVLDATVTNLDGEVTANTSNITQLQVDVGDNSAAIQTEQTARVNADGDIYAKYAVKVDVNGAVAGYGLMSTANDDTTDGSFSEFYVNAERFAILPQGDTPGGASTVAPFIVQGGVVYIDTAMIKDATITNAKIQSVAADKLTAGTIDASVIDVVNIQAENIAAGTISANTNSTSQVIQVSNTGTGVGIVAYGANGRGATIISDGTGSAVGYALEVVKTNSSGSAINIDSASHAAAITFGRAYSNTTPPSIGLNATYTNSALWGGGDGSIWRWSRQSGWDRLVVAGDVPGYIPDYHLISNGLVVGSYTILLNPSAGSVNKGETIAASSLSPAYIDGTGPHYSGDALSGTWKATISNVSGQASLWQRVA